MGLWDFGVRVRVMRQDIQGLSHDVDIVGDGSEHGFAVAVFYFGHLLKGGVRPLSPQISLCVLLILL